MSRASAVKETLVDARGLDCPLPLLKAKQALNATECGTRVRVLATDKGSVRDFKVFAEQSGHLLLVQEQLESDAGEPGAGAEYMYLIEKT